MLDNGFECKSGVLLWGQLHTVIEGYFSNEYDTPLQQPVPIAKRSELFPLDGGTILARNYAYRTKAQVGKWHVLPIYSKSNNRKLHHGYIVYHHNVDPISIVRECKFIGISLHNDHKNKRIVYINRYDWSYHHRLTDDTRFLETESDNMSFDDKDMTGLYTEKDMTGARFMLIDADCDLDDLKRCHITNGVHLTVDDTEYELGWQAFDDDNKLIAFVYDSYTMPFSENDLIVGNTTVITNEEYEKKLDVISDSEDDEYMYVNESTDEDDYM